MTPQRCSEHAWITITWLEDDGRRHSHDVFCRRCAERVTVTAAGDVLSTRRQLNMRFAA
jgi:hypothetical protein